MKLTNHTLQINIEQNSLIILLVIIMSVHAFFAVGHVKASNMVSPSLASVFSL